MCELEIEYGIPRNCSIYLGYYRHRVLARQGHRLLRNFKSSLGSTLVGLGLDSSRTVPGRLFPEYPHIRLLEICVYVGLSHLATKPQHLSANPEVLGTSDSSSTQFCSDHYAAVASAGRS